MWLIFGVGILSSVKTPTEFLFGALVTMASGLFAIMSLTTFLSDDLEGDNDASPEFLKLANVSEIPPGSMKSFDLKDRKILLANSDGSFFAIDDKCPHIGKPLHDGTLSDRTVTCKYHKAKFDLSDGHILDDAKLLFFKMPCKNARAYNVKLQDSDIWLEV